MTPRVSHFVYSKGVATRIQRPVRGFAIILVLGFVVLLTMLVVAFFSKALINRQAADSSANMERADLFAQGALDTIVGDLKQEIAARSSSTTTVTAGTIGTTLYSGSNALPALVSSSGTGGLENLLKISRNGMPFYTGGPARAAAVSSTSSSLNGRRVSMARWNKPLFLPKATPGSNTDFTPVGSFVAPDWILVSRDGVNPTAPSSDIVGRYAYAIYHEGGLLDVNVAGYPSGMAAADVSYKRESAYADLTQTGMTSSQVDALVNWRNSATLRNSPSEYAKYVASNATGFLTVGGTALNGGLSDQMFVSRQQLIEFFNSVLGGNAPIQNTLQYLATFSRDLNQPSLSPLPTTGSAARPTVLSDAGLYTSGTFGAYAGGNDGGYQDDDNINPGFLTIRATTAFPRNDKSTAIIGEPLAKKRFPLNRLAWLTYAGPITSDGSNYNPSLDVSYISALKDKYGFTDSYLLQGTADNIKKSFGLIWDSGNMRWSYDHDIASGAIGRLTDVQSLGREPDFFELLKASIAVGALGKGSAANSCQNTSSNSPPNLSDAIQYRRDTAIDYQIIQIGANIIDQADMDGYPTHIAFPAPIHGNSYDFYGIENLPYLYRARVIGLNTSGTTGVRVLLPEVWNPHDVNAPVGSPVPGDFRFLLVGASVGSIGGARYGVNSYALSGTALGTVNFVSLDSDSSVSNGVTELDFKAPSGAIAEPVFIGGLKGSSQSTAISLNPSDNNSLRSFSSDGFVTDTVSNLSYCGVNLGSFPTTFTIKSGTTQTVYPLSGPGNPSSGDICSAASLQQAQFVLQYKRGSNWVTYQESNTTLPSVGEVSTARAYNSTSPKYIDISVMTTGTQMSSTYGSPDTGDMITWMDPRTSRFGAFENPWQSSIGSTYHQWLTPTAPYYGNSNRPDATAGLMCGLGVGLPGTGLELMTSANRGGLALSIGWYPGTWRNAPGYFVPGYYAENTTGTRSYPKSGIYCFTDPDGVVRRGMSGYISTGTSSTVGMPMASTRISTTQSQSRPFILNRPFKMVAELGCVFSDTPWRHLDFYTPESGFSGLLDAFCICETNDSNAKVAGKLNLNTRQLPAVKAILAGMNNQGNAYKDEVNAGGAGLTDALSSSEIVQIAQALCSRTGSSVQSKGPLGNISELVGKWTGKVDISGGTAPHNIDGGQSYSGFSGDLTGVMANTSSANIQRLRESAIRALSASGQTRVWNLMIDLVAQSGRYRKGETTLSRFTVDGERRYWLHVAIDRYTGDIIDKQLELVEE